MGKAFSIIAIWAAVAVSSFNLGFYTIFIAIFAFLATSAICGEE